MGCRCASHLRVVSWGRYRSLPWQQHGLTGSHLSGGHVTFSFIGLFICPACRFLLKSVVLAYALLQQLMCSCNTQVHAAWIRRLLGYW